MAYKIKGDLNVSGVLNLGTANDLNNIPVPGVDGALMFDTSSKSLSVYHSGFWNFASFSCASLDLCSVDSFLDVDTTTNPPVEGQQLTWNGENWVPIGCGALLQGDQWTHLRSFYTGDGSFWSMTVNDDSWTANPDGSKYGSTNFRDLATDVDNTVFFSWTDNASDTVGTTANVFTYFEEDGDQLGLAQFPYSFPGVSTGPTPFGRVCYDPIEDVIWAYISCNNGRYNAQLVSIDVSQRNTWPTPDEPYGLDDLYNLHGPGGGPYPDEGPTGAPAPPRAIQGDIVGHGAIFYDGEAIRANDQGSIGPQTGHGINGNICFDESTGTLYFLASSGSAWGFFPITHSSHDVVGVPIQATLNHSFNAPGPLPPIVISGFPINDPDMGVVGVTIANGNVVIQADIAGTKYFAAARFADGETWTNIGYEGTGVNLDNTHPDAATTFGGGGYYSNVVRSLPCGGLYSGSNAVGKSTVETSVSVTLQPAGSLKFTGAAGDILKMDHTSLKVTVPNLLDPVAMGFTPVDSNPGGDLAETTFWVNSADELLYFGESLLAPIIYDGDKRFTPAKPLPAGSAGLNPGDAFIDSSGWLGLKL